MSGIQHDAASEHEGAGGAQQRPVVVLSGGNTTTPLIAKVDGNGKVVEKLLSEHFDIGLLYQQAVGPLKEKGLPVFSIDEGVTQDDQNEGFNWAAMIVLPFLKAMDRKRQNKVKDGLPKDKIFKPIADGLVDWMPGFVLGSCARMRTRIGKWKKLWEERDVRLVVVHEDVSEDTRSLVQFARARGTPTMHIPHYNHGTGYGLPDVHDKPQCDYAAVAGEYMVEWFAERGMVDGVMMTGHPAWDRFLGVKRDPQWARHALGLDPYRPVLCYATDWVLWTTLSYRAETATQGWATVLDAFKVLERNGWQLLCKVHPNAKQLNDQWHLNTAKQAGVRTSVTSRYPEVALQASDMLVSNGFSNIVAEAAILGVPSASLGHGYVDEPAVPNVPYDPKALFETVRDVMENRQRWVEELRPRFLERYVGPNDGQATARIVDWCMELAGMEPEDTDNGEDTREGRKGLP